MTRNVYVELDYTEGKNITLIYSIVPDSIGEGRLMRPLKYAVKVRTWVQNERTQSGLSKIRICNADGALDAVADKTFTECRIKEKKNGVISTLFTGKVDRVTLDGLVYMDVLVKDATKLLDKPLQSNLFPASETSITGSGTNTYYALEGQPYPVCWGINVRSVKPVLAKRSNNEYICHDEDVFNIATVYDNGTSVSKVHYNKGFTLTVDPAGRVVADVQGQELPNNSDRIYEFDDIVEYMLDTRETISYSTADASTINSDKGYRYSYYQDNTVNRTIKEVLKLHVDSHTGWFYADETGAIRFGYLKAPAATADMEISKNEVLDGVTRFDDLAPNLTNQIGGNRNWFVYNADDISAGVSEQLRLQLSNQWRNTYEAANTIDPFYQSTEKVHDSLVIGANAQSEIDNVSGLYSQRRRFYTFDSSVDAPIGDTVKLVYPRYGLDSGVNLLCVGREIDFIDNSYRLTLWG